ncbi:hypothetical protein [Phytomonospora endophytica]|uniref:Excreted virulence factor EspC (Type VII ESX diderm) n=1 Tax=Phytomonospora endophytica TaxID=714109 RepID=A0A841FP21_9ACTN|nr:hypothetical protein [Phytomonospora endophytica]MBB6034977.1 hypothetical protein [Phytomonospora endophytica]GIG71418.1 hypothetical protein Pen01_77130 [Phytomonospora endophytica]
MGFNVSTEELSGHLTPLTAVKDSVKRCKDASDQVGYGGFEAYGLFLQALVPPILEMCLGDATEMMNQAAELAGAFHKSIEANNECYMANETAIEQMWTDVHESGLFR